jgi:polyphenol oxidase
MLCPDLRIVHGVTTREGNLNLSFRTEPNSERVISNRRAATRTFGSRLEDLVVPEQIHAAGVAVARDADRGRGSQGYADALPGADAVITNVPGLLLGVTIADCLPVFFFDPVNRAVGLAHSGWRGTAGCIAERTLGLMASEFGTSLGDVVAAVGPGIGPECFEVGEEVVAAMKEVGAEDSVFRPSPNGRWLLDLAAVVTVQLLRAGIPPDNLSVAPWCTYCAADLFFSHRRDGPTAGRMGAFIKLV